MSKGIRTNPETVQALQDICKEKGGLLHPRDVVDSARAETSPLHKYFEWDDGKAAEAYRVEQARSLIQTIHVRMQMPNGKEKLTEVFVSLTTDRKDGGYRTVVDVLSDADMRNQLIRDALADMQVFTDRYKTLRELGGVFSSMRKAKKKLAA